jgi:peptidyl-prolyl cis-trans isomerase D
MLQSLGDKLKAHKWLGAIVLGLLAVIFAIWGAYGIVNISFGPADYGLKINGETINADTLNRAWQERQAQVVQSLNGGDLSEAQKQTLQSQLVDEYVRQTLLSQRAYKSGYRASDTDVAAAYQSEPAFQVEGKFDARAAQTMLAQAGMTPEMYETEQRQELETNQLTAGIQVSDFLTPTETHQIYALENEQRQLRYALLPADRYAPSKVDDATVKAWYQSHQSDYLSPESVSLQYAELRLDTIASQVQVTPEALQAFYQKNQARYQQLETRHAHHILIAVSDPKDPKADAAALAKARDVLAQLKAGKDFGALAKQYSADPASAAQGGDLGWATRTAYVPEFAGALFSMQQPGQLSGPVKTEFGYHIIRLDGVRPASTKSFDEVHAQVESEYRRDQAASIFGDRQEQLQQALDSGTVTDLGQLAHRFDLQMGRVDNFTRTGGGAPLGSKPELLRAAFSDDALSGQRITGPVVLAEDQIVIFKVLSHQLPAPEPIATVKDEIVAAIRKSDGTKGALAAAQDAVKQLQQGTSLDAVTKTLGVSAAPSVFVGRSDPQVPAQIRAAAFAAAKPDPKAVYQALALDDGGAAVIAVTAVKAGASGANPQNDQQLEDEYLKRDRQGELAAYILDMQQRAKVERSPTLFQ